MSGDVEQNPGPEFKKKSLMVRIGPMMDITISGDVEKNPGPDNDPLWPKRPWDICYILIMGTPLFAIAVTRLYTDEAF